MHSHKKLFAVAIISSTFGILCGPVASADAVPAYVTAAVNDGGRTPWDVARDPDRKPADVLAFSQIKRGMVVVDLIPGDGYYTRMLSKLVGPKGKVYAVVSSDGAGRGARMAQRDGKSPSFVPADFGDACVLGCYATGRPGYMLPIDQVLAIQNITEYSNVTVLADGLGQYGGDLAVPEQVDAVFTADGYHELHHQPVALPTSLAGRGTGTPKPLDVAAFDKAVFRTMKSGGIFVVLDYAAGKGAGFSAADSLHRTEADATKGEITAAGFVLDGESKALAMASDDHTKAADGVAANRDKADQYLFRFRKPANAPNTDKRPSKAREAAIMKNLYGNTFLGNFENKTVSARGARLRIAFYNPDHTYQEMGRLADGPGPMQSGTWWWDADGHNCELHQFPLDERANTVCHLAKVPEPIGVMWKGENGGYATNEIIPGHVLKGWVLP